MVSEMRDDTAALGGDVSSFKTKGGDMSSSKTKGMVLEAAGIALPAETKPGELELAEEVAGKTLEEGIIVGLVVTKRPAIEVSATTGGKIVSCCRFTDGGVGRG